MNSKTNPGEPLIRVLVYRNGLCVGQTVNIVIKPIDEKVKDISLCSVANFIRSIESGD